MPYEKAIIGLGRPWEYPIINSLDQSNTQIKEINLESQKATILPQNQSHILPTFAEMKLEKEEIDFICIAKVGAIHVQAKIGTSTVLESFMP